MFLSRLGAGNKYRFDEIYSCLQKSLRRGDTLLSLFMAKEFKQYPNALKKRLIQNCCEDCPNIYLIYDIYNTDAELSKLISFIPIICNHIKCREATLGFRVACQMKPVHDSLKNSDNDLLYVLRKCFTQMCIHNSDCTSILSFFQKQIPFKEKELKLTKLYNFLSKDRIVVYMLCAYKCIPYITDANYELIPLPLQSKFDLDNDIYYTDALPNYIYDKHVSKSPANQKTYAFFIENTVLIPRMPKTELELEGERLYITTNKASGEYIHSIIECDSIDSDINIIQTQLITSKYKQRVFYADISKDDTYSKVIKGPYKDISDMNKVLISDHIKTLAHLRSLNAKIISYNDMYYIMFDNVITIDPSNVSEHTSKLEQSIIYDGETYTFSDSALMKLDKKQKIELLKILAFRKIIGANDTCNRNIIFYNNTFTSIDDAMLLDNTSHMFKKELNQRIKNIYSSILHECKAEIIKWIYMFMDEVDDDNTINDESKAFMTERASELLKVTGWKW